MAPATSRMWNPETAQRFSDSSKELVTEHAMSATLAAFGIGLGLGMAAVYLMTSSPRQQSLPIAQNTAQQLGQRMLEALTAAIPDSLSSWNR